VLGDPGPERSDRAAPASTPTNAGPVDAALEAERVFLALCLAGGDAGREYLDRLTPAHLTSTALQRVKDHLAAHWSDPLAVLDPQDDPELASLVQGVAVRAEDTEPADGDLSLRMSFLALDLRRVDREIRQARADGNHERQSALAAERQRVRTEMDAVMGQVT